MVIQARVANYAASYVISVTVCKYVGAEVGAHDIDSMHQQSRKLCCVKRARKKLALLYEVLRVSLKKSRDLLVYHGIAIG